MRGGKSEGAETGSPRTACGLSKKQGGEEERGRRGGNKRAQVQRERVRS